MRSRIIVWVVSALPGALIIALFASIVTLASVPIAAKVIAGLSFIPIAALVLRTIFGFDLLATEHQLIYRAALRTYRIDRPLVASVSVDDDHSSWGLNNLKVVNLHQMDGTIFPLKLFNSFRPSEASPEPVGYRRMQNMAQDLTMWAESSPSWASVH